jgi:NAD+ synthase (glutamine-hydrolysing)
MMGKKGYSSSKYNHFGFVKVAAAVPAVKVGDCAFNTAQIISQIHEAEQQKVEVVVFPELCITGYTCADLFQQELLLTESLHALEKICQEIKSCTVIVGLPFEHHNVLYNVAAVLRPYRIAGLVPKSYLPNYREFYEQSWFTTGAEVDTTVKLLGEEVPFSSRLIFDGGRFKFGVEICEDVWAPIPPSCQLSLAGAEVIFNLSADDESIGKHNYLCSLLSQQSSRCLSGYVFSSCGFGESTTDVVFAGNGLIYEYGQQLAATERFSLTPQLAVSEIDVEMLRMQRRVNTTFAANATKQAEEMRQAGKSFTTVRAYDMAPNNEVFAYPGEFSLTRSIDPLPFVPSGKELDDRCEEIFAIQVCGLAKRLVHTQAKTAVIGISGGLDSTLALLVTTRTFDKLGYDRKGIIGVTMPGFGTTDRTYHNAIHLMEALGVTIREISIKEACIQHFKDINHDLNVHDVTYENGQARERTQLLMDIANQTNGLVIGTGDLSELALGWATYNGDHMSMYAVNTSIPKTLVKHLVNWVAINHMEAGAKETLLDIVDTPISPELIPADEQGNIKQKTEDLVGPYELHDFFLCHFFRFGSRPAKIYFLACQAFAGKYDETTIKKWLQTFFRRFFAQQFKRSCLPDGPKVGSVVLTPRGDWRMPSDASAALWLEECKNL